MEEYFDDDYFELEEENNPITEFIDKLKDSVKSEIKSELEAKDAAICRLIEDLDKLKAENESLQEKLSAKSALENVDKFAYNFLNCSKERFKTLNTAAEKSVFIKKILSDVFAVSNYDAFAHDRVDEVPMWLLAVVTFDKNAQEVFDVLKMYGVDFPKEARSIKLPQYWSNNDLKTFIDTIQNHYVCNGCIYENNLQFWKNFSLYDAKKQCNRSYSEIPWQLVLSNYNWHNWELLEQIGKVMFSRINGQYFAKMFTIYQSNWSDDEIRTVIKNIPEEDLKKFKFNSSELNAFVEKYIEYFDEDTKIRAVKSLYSVYTKLPFIYHKIYFQNNVTSIPGHLDKYTKEEARELMEIYYDRRCKKHQLMIEKYKQKQGRLKTVADKIVWVLTIDKKENKYKVVRSKKELQFEYTSMLLKSKTAILSLSASVYISFNCKMLHTMARAVLRQKII